MEKASVVTSYPRQAISTRYRGPTNTRGSRIVVTAEGVALEIGSPTTNRLIVPYDYGLSAYENHAAAAQAFADRQGWGGRWIGGGTPDGYVFVHMVTE